MARLNADITVPSPAQRFLNEGEKTNGKCWIKQ